MVYHKKQKGNLPKGQHKHKNSYNNNDDDNGKDNDMNDDDNDEIDDVEEDDNDNDNDIDNNDYDGSNSNDDNNNDDDAIKGDGLADMMSKILNQNVGKKIPVLAKRKLQIMKDDDKDVKNRLKMLKIAKTLEREKQLVIPDESNISYERQLRKLATRGVVALFNAIAKATKPIEQDDDNDNNSSKKTTHSTKKSIDEVRNMTQENFLLMLKNNNSLKSKETDNFKNNDDNDANNNNKDKNEKWAVLNDNLLINKKINLKNWDQDDDDDDEDNDMNALTDYKSNPKIKSRKSKK